MAIAEADNDQMNEYKILLCDDVQRRDLSENLYCSIVVGSV